MPLTGDRQHLIETFLPLVVFVAKRYLWSGLPLEDLVQEGSIGLIKAVESFDCRKGYKFSTYVYLRINAEIIRAIDNNSRMIRIPSHLVGVLRTAYQLSQQLGRKPTVEEIATETRLPVGKVKEVLAVQNTMSLDMPVGEDGTDCLADFIVDNSIPTPQEALNKAIMQDEVNQALKAVSMRERQVLTLRYGLDGQAHTLEEIGQLMGVTRERIRQIEKAALKKMKKMRNSISYEQS